VNLNHCYQGDCRDVMRELIAQGGAKSVQTIVTSPPYFGLRDYGHADQIGLEETPDEYIAAMVEVFSVAWDLLSDDGTLWLNIGDSYAGGGCGSRDPDKWPKQSRNDHMATHKKKHTGLKNKDLIGIPWMLAFALRADGWYLRQDIIWNKPNPMPESVTDRCTKAHEYIFLLTKSPRYYYDNAAIKEPLKDASVARLIQDIENQNGSDRVPGKTNGKMKAVKFGGNKYEDYGVRTKSGKEWNPSMAGGGSKIGAHNGYFDGEGKPLCGTMANKKSVWNIATKGYKEAHFATFPEELVEPCILAGSRAGDIVFDPFMGSGTVARVAQNLGRKWMGAELNPEYIELQDGRTKQQGLELPMREEAA
jgi:DNA modification methylase